MEFKQLFHSICILCNHLPYCLNFNEMCNHHLCLPPSILDRFLDLDWIFENLPMKSLGSNMSIEREAIRSRTIPSWPWLCFSRSWSWSWVTEGPLHSDETLLSAKRPAVFSTSSWDITPRGNYSSQSFSSSNLLKRHWNYFPCFNFSFLFIHIVSPVSPSNLRQLHWMQREWAHRFAVTGKQLFWDSKISPWESWSQSSVLNTNPSSWCSFGDKFSCCCDHLFIVSLPLSVLWSTDLFLCSQVVNKGGIQFKQHSLIGWFGKFGWFSYPVSLTLPSLSLWGFSN